MMKQADLTTFGYIEQIVPSDSAPGTNHILQIVDGKYSCSCKGYEFRGDCKHILRQKILDIRDRLRYYNSRKKVMSEAEFLSLDMAMERLSKDEEVNYISNIILLLARTEGIVNADMVYNVIGGSFSGSPNRMGVAFGMLARMGLIEWAGRHKSERKIRHAGKQESWKLSKDGKEMFRKGDASMDREPEKVIVYE